MQIEHLSVSRWQTYQQCPQKYKFKYELKAETTEPQPVFFLFGKLLHKITESFVVEKGKRSVQKITQDVLNGKILLEESQVEPPKKVLPPDYIAKIPSQVASFLQLTNTLGFDGLTEHKFNYDLDPPNNKILTGFIDRLIPSPNGNYYIVDYKTTKKGMFRKNRLNISDDIQLCAYALVVSKTYDVPAEKIRAALYYLDGGDLVGTRFTQQRLEDTEKVLREAYDEIASKDSKEVKGKVGKHCEFCDFRKICHFYSLT